ncbi:MAG: catechol 2,3-dioxygenase-like lactoylglutathione lyase family enzyme [Dinoroseobacter sp.]|jgi:catechol 2,3-dioxygenase-like lactoylglutathione lyase family enzyme
MELHLGRLIDHVHIRVADVARSKAFYRAALAPLGRDLIRDTEHYFTADELFVSGAEGGPISKIHLAFQAASPEMVQAFHAAALSAGGTNNGDPGARDYHPGYYGAFVRDPDGNNIEAVFHGPSTRSAASVKVTAEMLD